MASGLPQDPFSAHSTFCRRQDKRAWVLVLLAGTGNRIRILPSTVSQRQSTTLPHVHLTSSCTESRSRCLLLPAGERAMSPDREFGIRPLLVAILLVSPPPAPPPFRRRRPSRGPNGKHSSKSRRLAGMLSRSGDVVSPRDVQEGSIPRPCWWEGPGRYSRSWEETADSRGICRLPLTPNRQLDLRPRPVVPVH